VARIYQYHVEVEEVIDGDTFKGTVDLGMNLFTKDVHFRLLGVNTPEKDQAGYYEAKEYSAQQIEGKTVLITSYGKDKYGRWLVDVHLEGKTLNQLLLESKLAEKYE
jgi:micrococcal nuclease